MVSLSPGKVSPADVQLVGTFSLGSQKNLWTELKLVKSKTETSIQFSSKIKQLKHIFVLGAIHPKGGQKPKVDKKYQKDNYNDEVGGREENSYKC